MNDAESCTKNVILYPAESIGDGGGWELAIPYGEETRWDEIDDGDYDLPERCHDCGVKLGGFHHPGCDIEESPRTGHQLLSELLSIEDTSKRPVHANAMSDPHHNISTSDIVGR
jgi:hypothetical protein